jgi:hypothetical protein
MVGKRQTQKKQKRFLFEKGETFVFHTFSISLPRSQIKKNIINEKYRKMQPILLDFDGEGEKEK